MTKLAVLCVALAAIGCKKTGSTGGGGGGGGGGWFTSSTGRMQNVTPAGALGRSYDVGSSADLRGIACRYAGEAWVVGNAGTLLYTSDGGDTWSAEVVPTTADLRTLATQDEGPVFIAGNGTFLVTKDSGASWTELSNSTTQFRSVAAAQAGDTVLALGDDGSLWNYNGALTQTGTLTGMRALAVSEDGQVALAAGNGIMISRDAGATWNPLSVDHSITFDDVRISDDGDAVAVGANGAIANIDGATGAVSVQHVGNANLHTLALDDTGYTAGDGGQVLVTHDGGLTWSFGPVLGGTIWGVDEIGEGHR